MVNLCTYFDEFYLARALALHASLQEHCPSFHLFALCMDDNSYAALQQLHVPTVTAIPLRELEQANPCLRAAKADRSLVEYYWTCGPAFLLHVLERFPELGLVCYIDADTYFFSDPSPLLAEMEGASVGIVEHRFGRLHRRQEKFGKYNVGWLAFRRDEAGLAALRWWSASCLQWCYDRSEDGKYADQKYLDEFPARFPGVRVLQHKGINVAVWNVANYDFSVRRDRVYVDEQPLIFFHFHGFKQLTPWLFDTNMGLSGRRLSRVLRREVFGRYIRALVSLAPLCPARSRRIAGSYSGWLARNAKRAVRIGWGVVNRSYILLIRGQLA